MLDHETQRLRHVELFRSLWPEYLSHLNWDAEAMAQYREDALRKILRVAKEQSLWYRRRLSHIDPDTATEANLTAIPPMSKDDLMSNFDDILTERRLSLGLVEAHLAGLTDDTYLQDEFHAVASGGSSGTRGVFVYGWAEWAKLAILSRRFRIRHEWSHPELGVNATRATVAAGKATHVSYSVARTFQEIDHATPISAALPLDVIVERLNKLQPAILQGYPSILYSLAGETTAGRLRIQPRMIVALAEPLLPEMRTAMEDAWRSTVFNSWGASEGAFASSCGQGPGMHLGEDFTIFELVDAEGKAVPPGVRAAKMYITNLYNYVQPLIRYELTDEVTLIDEPCSCGCRMRRIDDVQGRSDDVFVYDGGTVIHPLVFRSRLGSDLNIVEYQVTQTKAGAHVAVRARAVVDRDALSALLERDLAAAGLGTPEVIVEIVESIDRQQTGKLKRFIPIDSGH